MTKTILSPTLLVLASTFGCSSEADIGLDSRRVIDSEPVTCNSSPDTAEVVGWVVDPETGTRYDFGAASASALIYSNGSATLSLGDDTLLLRLGFSCQTHAPGTYTLVADGQQRVNCPIEVAGAVFGQIEYLPAESGEVIVDDGGNCLAGRFHADFGDDGELTGWFRAPWQPYP
jgi:hypothetical protein